MTFSDFLFLIHVSFWAELRNWRQEIISSDQNISSLKSWIEKTTMTEEIRHCYKSQNFEIFMTIKRLNARQVRWVEFLFKFYFSIKYCFEKTNILTDILSCLEMNSIMFKTNSRMQILLKSDIVKELIKSDVSVFLNLLSINLRVINRILNLNKTIISLNIWWEKTKVENENRNSKNDLLLYKSKLMIFVKEDNFLSTKLLNEIHRQSSTTHSEIKKTKHLIKIKHYWKIWRADVQHYIKNCVLYCQNKIVRDKNLKLLQSLSVLNKISQHIFMNFMKDSKFKLKHEIMLIMICRLSKKSILIFMIKRITIKELTRLIIQHFYQHYEAFSTIVFDREFQFIFNFWNEFCKLLSTKLKLFIAHHAEIDEQMKIVNQYFVSKLKSFVSHYQNDWDEWLLMINHVAIILLNILIEVFSFLTVNELELRTSLNWKKLLKNVIRDQKLNWKNVRERVAYMKKIWETIQ